jgi:uncharacterized protein
VNVVDPILRKGFRFKGTATVHASGEVFERGLEILRAQGSTMGRDRARSIVVIAVTDAAELISPAYDDGTSEHGVSGRWLEYVIELHRSRQEQP